MAEVAVMPSLLRGLAAGALRSASRRYAEIRERRALRRLLRSRVDQVRRFVAASAGFTERYRSMKDLVVDRFLVDQWSTWNARLEKELLPSPPLDFLTLETIANTMFVRVGGSMMEQQLDALRAHMPRAQLGRLLHEDAPGTPTLKCPQLMTSHNSIHHLYHFERHRLATGIDISAKRRIVEWGGGYGNQAKLLSRLTGGQHTHVIIDTPLFSCLQHLYLESVLGGAQHVVLHTAPRRHGIVEGAINLMPLALAKDADLRADLFLSTWALSESSADAQDFVAERNWFGARHVLLAYQESSGSFPFAERMRTLAGNGRMTVEPVRIIPKNFYAFR